MGHAKTASGEAIRRALEYFGSGRKETCVDGF